MMNGFYADLTYYVAADTKLPVQILMDMSQTDMSAYAELMNDSIAQQMGDASSAESRNFCQCFIKSMYDYT